MVPISENAFSVLLVDDDARLRDLLTRFLTQEGFNVMKAENGAEALAILKFISFECIILDGMMPVLDGLGFLETFRKSSETPILMLSARSEVEHRLAGLERGADDYLAKPFEPRELLLRLKTLLKRNPRPIETLSLNASHRTLTIKDVTVPLTDRETEILQYLWQAKGTVVPRHLLNTYGEGRAVDNLIKRLRQKCETYGVSPDFLQTIRGRGYRLLP